jgi:hypothetical protein
MVGKFLNQKGWTDVEPYEIVKVVSAKQVIVRPMDAVLDPSWQREVSPGGFAGHVMNNHEQKWNITSNPTAPERRVRLGKKGWKDAYGNYYSLSDSPRKFYDYNF